MKKKIFEKRTDGIHHPDFRGKQRKSTAQFGGMGERELQSRMELLVDEVLSSQKRLIEPAKTLAKHSLADQEKFLTTIERMRNCNVDLAFNFCHLGSASLRLLNEDQWSNWIQYLLKIYDTQGLNQTIEKMQNVEKYLELTSDDESNIHIDKFLKIIGVLLTGLSGRKLKIEISNNFYTDTETIFLPEKINKFPTKEENFELLKTISVHLWAQTKYGTWNANLDYFNDHFADNEKAFKLFHILETIRLDAQIKQNLPGIGRIIDKLNPIYREKDLGDEWQAALKKLSNLKAEVKDTLQLLFVLYDLETIELDSPYCGVLFPEKVKNKRQKRIKEQKIAFKKALDNIQNEHPAGMQDQDEKSNFTLKDASQDENESNAVVELELNGDQITMSENVEQLLESIYQDLGEIPDDYLQPSGDGKYNADETPKNGAEQLHDGETEQKIETLEFLYDEWDHSRGSYRKNWCHLYEKSIASSKNNFAERTLQKHRGILKHLNRTFESLKEEDKRQKKQPYGDDIDLDAFIECYADYVKGNEITDCLFTKLKKVDRNIAVMFMIDMSGSTSGWINEMEKAALILLCESLEILGDRYAIYGFSGRTRNVCELYRIKKFEEPYTEVISNRIGGIEPCEYTRMGVTIRHLTKLLTDIDARTKILITLSDGKPDDLDGYRGAYGIEDTRMSLVEARFLGIHPYCITIDKEALDYLPHMYGAANFAVVDHVDQLPYKVSDIYRRITM